MAKEIDIKPSARTVYTYDVPPLLQKTSKGVIVKTIGVAELQPLDEIEATKRARGDAARLAFELALQSLATVNGTPVSLGDGSAETAWTSLGPKLRNLVMSAYAENNQAGQNDLVGFLASRKG